MRGIALRAGLVAVAVVVVAASASAFDVFVTGVGTYTPTLTGLHFDTAGGVVLDNSIRNPGDPGYGVAADIFTELTADISLPLGNGAFTLTDSQTPADQLNGLFTDVTGGANGLGLSYRGKVTFVGAPTGVYQNYNGIGTGSGSVYLFQFIALTGSSAGDLTIAATPVPEPFTLLLGAGALAAAIARRRTRKA